MGKTWPGGKFGPVRAAGLVNGWDPDGQRRPADCERRRLGSGLGLGEAAQGVAGGTPTVSRADPMAALGAATVHCSPGCIAPRDAGRANRTADIRFFLSTAMAAR